MTRFRSHLTMLLDVLIRKRKLWLAAPRFLRESIKSGRWAAVIFSFKLEENFSSDCGEWNRGKSLNKLFTSSPAKCEASQENLLSMRKQFIIPSKQRTLRRCNNFTLILEISDECAEVFLIFRRLIARSLAQVRRVIGDSSPHLLTLWAAIYLFAIIANLL